MKNHTKVWLKSRGLYQPNMVADDLNVMDEWDGSGPVVDINHISPRGRGGSKLKDSPYNLIGLTRKNHDKFEAGLIDKEEMLLKVKQILK